MGRKRRRVDNDRAQMLANGFIKCISCGDLSKPGSMRCQGCQRLLPKGKRILSIALVTIIISSSSGGLYLLSQNTKPVPLTSVLEYSPSSASAPIDSTITVVFTREMNRTSVERSFSISPQINGTFEWSSITLVFKPDQPMANSTAYYVSIGKDSRDFQDKPLDSSVFQWSFMTTGPHIRRSIGTDVNSFWIARPSATQSSSNVVEHPQWIIDSLNEGVVMILDHSETCRPCIEQTAICEKIMDDDPEDIVFFDLLSGKSEPQATEVFMTYDPDGGLNYIPLTVIVTKVPDQDGGSSIVWHSWEGVVPEAILESWIGDAQEYYNEASLGQDQ